MNLLLPTDAPPSFSSLNKSSSVTLLILAQSDKSPMATVRGVRVLRHELALAHRRAAFFQLLEQVVIGNLAHLGAIGQISDGDRFAVLVFQFGRFGPVALAGRPVALSARIRVTAGRGREIGCAGGG